MRCDRGPMARVTIVTDWWPPRVGGVESQVADLARRLAAHGYSVHVLTTTRNPTPIGGVCVEHLPLPMAGEIAVPDLRRVRDIAAAVARSEPDIVHAHGMFSSLAIGGVMAAHRLGVPSVHTVHSLLRPWPVFVAGAALSRSLSRHASAITAVSRATAGDVTRAAGRTPFWIPNGLDLAEWRPSARPRSHDLHIVALTRLVTKKAPHVLLNALASTLSHVRRPVHLTIAGDGPERRRLERQAVRLGVAPHVTFRGACSRDDVRALLAEASIFVQPGRMEAFGLAVLEARASGVPVVAMRSGGIPELVEDGRHGLLADTEPGFARALIELCANDARRARLAAAAPRDLERFDWACVVAAYREVYFEAIARAQTSGRHAKKSAAATA